MALGDDPFRLGRGTVLDNTPHWLEDGRTGSDRGLGFCNPYGFETDEIRVMGGLRDPRAEAYVWQCRNHADARYYMICANGHGRDRSTVMRLCYAHVYMITKRQAGLCPRCVMPPRARELEETCNHIMRELHRASPEGRRHMMSRLEDCRRELDEMRMRGTITTGAPLTLEEVS